MINAPGRTSPLQDLLGVPRRLLRGLLPPSQRVWLATALRRGFYFGVKYRCPFCGGRFRRLLPFGLDLPVFRRAQIVGGGRRDHALCPVCLSSDRERLVFLYLQHRTALLRTQHTLLHVAPERHLQDVLRRSCGTRYVSADLSSPDVMVRLDLVHSPFGDATFDAIICNHVLEHIPDDRAAMSELLRVLKPGGWALLQVPIGRALRETVEDPLARTPEARENAFGQADHVRIYAEDYKQKLESVGFKVCVDGFVEQLGPAQAQRYGLDARERLYVCSKAAR